MAAPFDRTIDKPTGKVSIAPQIPPGAPVRDGIPTTIFPAGALTQSGKWVPLFASEDGALFISTDSNPGTPYFDDSQQIVTPGVEQILVDQIVPPSVARSIMNVIVVARCYGSWVVDLDGAIIGAGRTGPGSGDPMTFIPARPMQPGQTYRVSFTSRLNAPAQSVECFLQATDNAK